MIVSNGDVVAVPVNRALTISKTSSTGTFSAPSVSEKSALTMATITKATTIGATGSLRNFFAIATRNSRLCAGTKIYGRQKSYDSFSFQVSDPFREGVNQERIERFSDSGSINFGAFPVSQWLRAESSPSPLRVSLGFSPMFPATN